MKKFGIFSLAVLLIITGCAPAAVNTTPTVDVDALVKSSAATLFAQHTETVAAMVPTASVTVTPTLPPTITSTSVPIPPPVDAVAASNVTVRAEPRKGGKNVGGIFFNQGMKVIARNDAATWYYIEWSKSPTGTAWVLAAAVNMKENDPTHLPIAIVTSTKKVVILPPLLWEITGTPLPLSGPAAGVKTAVIQQTLKVRVGPGVGYSTMGDLNVGITVVVTGRTDSNDWLQIEYPSGPGGHGWVASSLVTFTAGFAGLPFFNSLATPIIDPELAGSVTPDPNETPEATPTLEPTPAGPPGQVTASKLVVHSGPASSFAAVGTLNLGDTVFVTGETLNQLWYRIAYPDAPNGYGYVSVKYIKASGGDWRKLVYINDLGTPIKP